MLMASRMVDDFMVAGDPRGELSFATSGRSKSEEPPRRLWSKIHSYISDGQCSAVSSVFEEDLAANMTEDLIASAPMAGLSARMLPRPLSGFSRISNDDSSVV